MKLLHLNRLARNCVWNDTVGLVTRSLGAAAGSERLYINLDVGTVEPEDTCYYPDEDMYLQKSGDERRVFSGAALQTAWDSSPNEGIKL